MRSQQAAFDPVRELAFGGISGSYAAVGSALTKRARGFCLTNNTEGDMMFSLDGSNDHLFVHANSFKLWDVQSNCNPQFDDRFVIPIGTIFYVKQLEAPVSGSVYVELLIDA